MIPAKGVAWAFLVLVSGAVAAYADVTVETRDDQVVIGVQSPRVVAWKPTREGIAVLAEGEGEVQIVSLPGGWQGDVLEQNGMHGVFLRGRAASWSAVQESGKWLVREGAPRQKEVSALLLRDGWRVDGVQVPTRRVDVGGQAWQVALLPQALSVAGSVVGIVRQGAGRAEDVPVSAAEDMRRSAVAAPVSPAVPVVSSATRVSSIPAAAMKPVSVDQMLSRLEPAAGNIAVALRPVSAPSGIVSAAAVAGGQARVSFQAADPLAAVPVPPAASESVPLPSMAVGSGGLYVPGTLVSVTVPQDILERRLTSDTLPVAVVPAPAVAPVMVHSMFPAAEGPYADAYAEHMQALADALTTTAEQEARRSLVAFFLAWQRPEEARAAISLLPKRKDGLPADPVARLFLGVALLAMDKEPPEGVFDQEGGLEGHARLWKAVALAKGEDYGAALKAWPRERGILPEYPVYLRQMAQQMQAASLVMVGDKDVALKVLDELVSQYAADEVPPALTRLQGLVRLGTSDERKGLEYLARAAESQTDLATAYRAKFEFVESLHRHKDLSDAQVLKYLEELWLDWRGDRLERDVLGELADLYERAGEPREALERWQSLVRAFPNIPDLNAVTDRMTQAFVDVFDPENPKSYDPLTYLGLYYDFRELIPNDERGDRVQEQVAKLLTDSTLWQRAIPILEQQLSYRQLDPIEQARLALMLAEAYRRQGKAADGLKLLDKWQKVVASNSVLIRGWRLAQARCLMDLSRFDSAKRTLEPLKDDREALAMRIEADWNLKNWQGAAQQLQLQLGGVTPASLVSDTAAQLSVFQLAYAYGQLKNPEALKGLRDRYAKALEKLPDLADGVNAVAAGTGMSAAGGGGVLAPLTGTLASLNGLTDQIDVLRTRVERVREERKEYNEKMRYMELLPPPVI